jgi:hypothetical protein
MVNPIEAAQTRPDYSLSAYWRERLARNQLLPMSPE